MSLPPPRYLFLTGLNETSITRYNLITGLFDVICNDDNFPLCLTVDEDNNVIYWVNYDATAGKYFIMKSFYNMTTVNLKSFSDSNTTSLKMAHDKNFIYILDSSGSRIYKMDKETASTVLTIPIDPGSSEVSLADGTS